MLRCVLSAFTLLALLGTGQTSAQSNIGEMAEVVGTVMGVTAGRSEALRNGAPVVQNEMVSTAAASTARVAFHDLTSLALAPSSSVRLDRYVFAPDATASAAVVKLTRGAFRFVSGNSQPQAITIRTPGAVIGLRGTVLDIEIRPGREIVWLRRGAARVCRGRQCVDLDRQGDGVFVTAAGVSSPSSAPQAFFDFDALTANRFPLFGPR